MSRGSRTTITRRGKLGRRLALVVCLVSFAAGCAAAEREARPLLVSAAVSFAPALGDALALYRLDRPDTRIEINAAASGVLLQQARRGARVDVFISASSAEIEKLLEWNLAEASTRRPLASNRLVVVVPSGSTPPSEALRLTSAGSGAIAIGNPETAPIGRYTRQALQKLSIWESLESRLVLAENARQALDYVGRGEVDAAVVYRTDARMLAGSVIEGPEIPPDLHDPIAYEGIVLRGAEDPEAALELLDWLASPAAREPLLQRGFLAPRSIKPVG